ALVTGGADSGGPERAVFAASESPLSRVTVETDTLGPTDLLSFPVTLDGHTFTAFVGFVPTEDVREITLVAYDASGRELDRQQWSTDDPAFG
ncbi:MAG TPA: hypothetical protein VH479_19400, partial [Acidimicrobiales bacterium]